MTILSTWETIKPHFDDFLIPTILSTTITNFSATVGVTPSELRLFLSLLLAYPLAYTWRKLPTSTSRHIFSITTGFWLLSFVIGHQFLFILSSSLFCYFLMLILGPKSAAKPVAIISMLVLACGHLWRQYTDYLGWTLDWTMQQMIITQKLHALAYNIKDGQDDKASMEQKARSVDKIPSLLEFLSFLLFPGNVVIGPTFEFRDYVDFAEGKLVAPDKVGPAFWRFVEGLMYFGLHEAIRGWADCGVLLQDKVWMNSVGFVRRYVVVWIALLGVRFKYYFGWKIAEGACCMSGLGFNGVDKENGNELWNRVENVDVVKYEFSQSLRTSSSSWNKTTNLWLRRYVYDRCDPKYRLYFTFMVSAFWHGFYPGYYMFFLSIAIGSAVHRNIRRAIRPRFMMEDGVTPGPHKFWYDVASALVTTLTLNYFIMSFVVLALDQSLNAFKGFSYLGHVGLFAAVVIFNSGIIPKPKKKLQAKSS